MGMEGSYQKKSGVAWEKMKGWRDGRGVMKNKNLGVGVINLGGGVRFYHGYCLISHCEKIEGG